ncbi:AAA domain-containing protein [Catenulispora yoronensis]
MAALRTTAEELQTQADEVDERLRSLPHDVHDRCRVLGATVAEAIASQQLPSHIDVVVIDEAGMVDLPSAWQAAGLAARRLIVAGDFRQLPPPAEAGQDLFHAAGIVKDNTVAEDDPRLAVLRTQYRMRAPICDLVKAVAYPDSHLRTGRHDAPGAQPSRPSPQSRPSPPPGLPDAPLILVDTSTRRVAQRHRDGAHLTNEVHEAVLHEIIRALQASDTPPTPDNLAVVTPYREQADNLTAGIEHCFAEARPGLLAGTVHQLQGGQRPVVVFDTVAGAGAEPGSFFDGTALGSDTCRLLNVGLSRAQDQLVVVADVEYLRDKVHSSPVRRMLDHLEQHAFRWPVDDLIPLRTASQLGRLSSDDLDRPVFVPAHEVAGAVQWDIEQARKSIDIYCAFLGAAAVGTWLRHLEPRVAAGVTVTVHTRAAEAYTDTAADAASERQRTQIARLRAAGCQVRTRERMHEKVMILDSEVLWHGALNLLAHTGSQGLMMRLTSGPACDRVHRFLDGPHPGPHHGPHHS